MPQDLESLGHMRTALWKEPAAAGMALCGRRAAGCSSTTGTVLQPDSGEHGGRHPTFRGLSTDGRDTAGRSVCSTEVAGRLRSSDHVDDVEASGAAGEDVTDATSCRVRVIHPDALSVLNARCSVNFALVRLQEDLDGWVYGKIRDVDD